MHMPTYEFENHCAEVNAISARGTSRFAQSCGIPEWRACHQRDCLELRGPCSPFIVSDSVAARAAACPRQEDIGLLDAYMWRRRGRWLNFESLAFCPLMSLMRRPSDEMAESGFCFGTRPKGDSATPESKGWHPPRASLVPLAGRLGKPSLSRLSGGAPKAKGPGCRWTWMPLKDSSRAL